MHDTTRIPGTYGLIAAISDQTAQVQGSDGQTAVTWTDETTFTQQASGTLADITVGSCVSVRADSTDGDTVTATSVTVTQPVDGSCASGFGGMGGGSGPQGGDGEDRGTPPSGGASGRPGGDMPEGEMPEEGMPSGMPSADASAAPGGRGGGLSGSVIAISDGVLTVTSTGVPSSDEDASAMQVGRCAQAVGDTDSTGAVTATTILIGATATWQVSEARAASRYVSATATAASLDQTLTASGTVEASDTATASFPASAEVTSVAAQVGDTVTVGQVHAVQRHPRGERGSDRRDDLWGDRWFDRLRELDRDQPQLDQLSHLSRAREHRRQRGDVRPRNDSHGGHHRRPCRGRRRRPRLGRHPHGCNLSHRDGPL